MKVNKNRVNLSKAIPLEHPLAIVVELTSRCNFACEFCPTATPADREHAGWTRQDMTWGLFTKLIKELKSWPAIKMFYNGMGESMIHPQYLDMMKFAVDAGISDFHCIRTNGSMFEPDFNRKLIATGITNINISI